MELSESTINELPTERGLGEPVTLRLALTIAPCYVAGEQVSRLTGHVGVDDALGVHEVCQRIGFALILGGSFCDGRR